MSERYLDLDAFAAECGKVKFKGETYEIADVNVEIYAKAIKLQEEIDSADNIDDAMSSIMKLVGAMVPNIPEKVLKAMSIKQLSGLLNFVTEDLKGEIAKNAIAPTVAPTKYSTKKKKI